MCSAELQSCITQYEIWFSDSERTRCMMKPCSSSLIEFRVQRSKKPNSHRPCELPCYFLDCMPLSDVIRHPRGPLKSAFKKKKLFYKFLWVNVKFVWFSGFFLKKKSHSSLCDFPDWWFSLLWKMPLSKQIYLLFLDVLHLLSRLEAIMLSPAKMAAP